MQEGLSVSMFLGVKKEEEKKKTKKLPLFKYRQRPICASIFFIMSLPYFLKSTLHYMKLNNASVTVIVIQFFSY